MATIYSSALQVTACVTLLALSACAREGQDQMGWARAALERNGQVEVVAADQQSHSFTVRVKDTGELRVVRADQLIALPPGAAVASAPGVAARVPAPSTAAAPAMAASAPAQTEPEPAQYGEAARPSLPEYTHADAAGGKVLEAGPGYSIKAAGAAPVAAQPAANQLLESGPGYSIKAGAAAAAPAAVRSHDSRFTSAALEHRHEPIICQGDRMLVIDNRNMQFDGDAVSAQDGCEIHITNSHITATGVGVQARAANVHIDNSSIEGDNGSLDLSDGAQAYATASQFKGLSRRVDSSFHDLGGNIWN